MPGITWIGGVGRIALAAVMLALAAPAAAQSDKAESAQELFERAYYLEHGLKKLDEAAALYRRVAALASGDRKLEARALLRIAACERQRGRDMEALEIAKRVLEDYSDLPEIKREAEASVTEAGAARQILRIYDVAMLTTEAREPAPSPRLGLPADSSRGGGASGASLTLGEESPPGVAIPPDRLLELIRTNIAPDSWEHARSRSQIEGGRLIVVQSPEVHAEIEAYLEQLRGVRGRLITIEATLAFVDGKVLRDLGAGPILTTEQAAALERRLRAGDGAKPIARPRATVLNRQPAVMNAVRTRRFLGDYDVNQTGVTPTVAPATTIVREGAIFEVRPILVEGAGHVLLQVRIHGAAWNAELSRLQDTTHGRIDLPAVDEAAIETALLAPSGATVLAGALRPALYLAGRPPDADGRLVLLLRATVSALAAPAKEKEGGAGEAARLAARRPLRSYNVSLLTEDLEPLFRRQSLLRSGEGSPLEFSADGDGDASLWGRPLGEDTLVDLIKANISPESWESSLNRIAVVSEGAGELVVIQTPEVHAQIQGYLAALKTDRATLLHVECFELALDDAAFDRVLPLLEGEGTTGNTLPASALEDLVAGRIGGARLVRWAGVAALNGQGVRLGEARAWRVIEGYESLSGGTGMVVQTEIDPTVGTVAEGFELDVRAKVVPGGRLVMADVALESARLDRIVDQKTKWGVIDLPVLVRAGPTAQVTFPVDRVLVVQMGQGLEGIQERTLTLLRVRPVDALGGK